MALSGQRTHRELLTSDSEGQGSRIAENARPYLGTVARLTSAYPATPTGTNTTSANSRCIVPSANMGVILCIIRGIINSSATALQRRYILKAMLCRHNVMSKSTGAARVGNNRNCQEACRGSGIGNIPAFKDSTPLATTQSATRSASAVQVA